MTRSFLAALVGSIAIVLGSAPSSAQMAYITNSGDNTVSVISTATNTVIGTIPVGNSPQGVAVSPDGSTVYVTNSSDNTVSVIDTPTNMVVATIPIGSIGFPVGVAVAPDGSKVYVTKGFPANEVLVIDTETNTVIDNLGGLSLAHSLFGLAVTPDGSKVYVADGGEYNVVLVIDTATDTGIAEAPVQPAPFFPEPFGVAVTPDSSKVYVTQGDTVSVIDTATNTVITTIPAGGDGVAVTPDGSKVYLDSGVVIDTATNTVTTTIPVSGGRGVAVTPDGSKVYVVGGNGVSVIDTATNTVVAVLPVGKNPIAFGVFIQPRFAGTPGNANCHDNSTSALAQTFGGLKQAAIALGFPTVQGLQTAVNAFCGV